MTGILFPLNINNEVIVPNAMVEKIKTYWHSTLYGDSPSSEPQDVLEEANKG